MLALVMGSLFVQLTRARDDQVVASANAPGHAPVRARARRATAWSTSGSGTAA